MYLNFMQKQANRLGLLCLFMLLFAFLSCQHAYAQKPPKGATSEQVFEILASEIALQRGEAGLAYQTYLSLARQTGEADLAQRAMEIAIAANAPDLALAAAQTWDELSKPSQTRPKEVLVTLLMLNQRWSESVKPAVALLNQQPLSEREKTLKQWQGLIGRAMDESAAMLAYYKIISALVPLPSSPDVLYSYALAAEKAGQFEVMEKTLRIILKKDPNNVNSLNALGYSLADRNIKLTEAYDLILKAHKLSPDDAFILDSLGWVNFRLGKTSLALTQLQDAFRMKPEADIAAHLGEVLWVLGRPLEAEAAWRQGELIDANNATLKETIRRLKPDWIMSLDKLASQWDGRFAVKMNDRPTNNTQGGSGSFTLSKTGFSDTLEIRSPMGGAIAKIVINPGEAILERDGKKVMAIDADTLIQNTLGLPLPARGLSNWLNGQVRPGSAARLVRDERGQVKNITQDGWDLAYKWSDAQKIERLNMTRNTNTGTIDVRLIFDQVND
ncbi:MAG: tetratricopeptide repeat protein [Burkholderiales bacterium]|nr:tetratricopeptide repeat protein [Burkholderiales bacterium]